MDPLADKLLVSSAMIALIGMDDAVVPLSSVVVYNYCKRIYDNRFQNTCSGTEHCNCCRFLGKLKTICQNVYDYICF